MSKSLRALQGRRAAHVAAMRAITDKAAGESRDLTTEEQTAFDSEQKSLASVKLAITREEQLIAEEGAVVVPPNARISGGELAIADDPKRGFRCAGEFLRAAVVAGKNFDGARDERMRFLAAAPTTFGSEVGGPDGGFAIPPEFANQIWTFALEEDSLIPLTENTEVTGNSMVFPKDETTPWGTDGIRAYWQAEATAGTPTAPKLSTNMLRLYKLMGLVPLTDELLEDTNALNGYVPLKVGQSIRYKVNEAILFGSGVGTPGGAFQGNCAIVQAKESGQATLTLVPNNIFKMIARLPAGSYPRAVWMMGPDTLPFLFGLTLGNYPIYLPPTAQVGGIQINPYGSLMGRPIMVNQHAAAFSSQGDVLLGDFSYYRTITKAGGIQTATSMHLYFDADVTAFRTIFRIDGQPKIVNPIAQAKGSNTLSPFVQLQAR